MRAFSSGPPRMIFEDPAVYVAALASVSDWFAESGIAPLGLSSGNLVSIEVAIAKVVFRSALQVWET